MAKKHLVLILTEPTEGREQEYNDYYENLHLREVIETTNLKTAQRFKDRCQMAHRPISFEAINALFIKRFKQRTLACRKAHALSQGIRDYQNVGK